MDTTVILLLVLLSPRQARALVLFELIQDPPWNGRPDVFHSEQRDRRMQRLERYPVYYNPANPPVDARQSNARTFQFRNIQDKRARSIPSVYSYEERYIPERNTQVLVQFNRRRDIINTATASPLYVESNYHLHEYNLHRRQYPNRFPYNQAAAGADATRIRDESYFRSQIYPKPIGWNPNRLENSKNSKFQTGHELLRTAIQRDPLEGLNLPGLEVAQNVKETSSVIKYDQKSHSSMVPLPVSRFEISNVDPLSKLKLPETDTRGKHSMDGHELLNAIMKRNPLHGIRNYALRSTDTFKLSDIDPLSSLKLPGLTDQIRPNVIPVNDKVQIQRPSEYATNGDFDPITSHSVATHSSNTQYFINLQAKRTSKTNNSTVNVMELEGMLQVQSKPAYDLDGTPLRNTALFGRRDVHTNVNSSTNDSNNDRQIRPISGRNLIRLSNKSTVSFTQQNTTTVTTFTTPLSSSSSSSTTTTTTISPTTGKPVYNANPMLAWFNRFKSAMAETRQSKINRNVSSTSKEQTVSKTYEQTQRPSLRTFTQNDLRLESRTKPNLHNVQNNNIVNTLQTNIHKMSSPREPLQSSNVDTKKDINLNVPATNEDIGIPSRTSLLAEVQKMKIQDLKYRRTLENSKSLLSFSPSNTSNTKLTLPTRSQYIPGAMKITSQRESYITTTAMTTAGRLQDPLLFPKSKTRVPYRVINETNPAKFVSEAPSPMSSSSDIRKVTPETEGQGYDPGLASMHDSNPRSQAPLTSVQSKYELPRMEQTTFSIKQVVSLQTHGNRGAFPLFGGKSENSNRARTNVLSRVTNLFNDPTFLALIRSSQNVRIAARVSK
ncbi:uncharacterized protein LOC121377559 [Gigantopelta aegis]|uniref:uncharacterized protein LOC121377559 n=1 Tax=Gigantopelta aegis TaxID=1735272 RepID=UPI001B88AEB4|nr:uncharacterized protein LOC121377559 [Gigantopelta aegis]